jgi:hypothetical protein
MNVRFQSVGTMILISALLFPCLAFSEPKLTWESSSGDVEGYRIHYGTKSGQPSSMKDVGNVTEYPLSGLPLVEKQTYYLTTTAYNAAGESGNSNEVIWTAPDNTAPAPPQGVNIQ